MKRNFYYLLIIYAFTISIVNLVLTFIVGSIFNAILFYFNKTMFTLENWAQAYVIGCIIMFIANFNVFLTLYEENKND